MSAQFFEAVDYLHRKAEIIHNDITFTNILLGPPTMLSNQCTSTGINIAGNYQIVLIDFGKATKCEKEKMLHSSCHGRLEYQKNYPYIAPEVREGEVSTGNPLLVTFLLLVGYCTRLQKMVHFC